MNPCGLACDIGRRPYRTKFKPFRDSDAEVIIRWYSVPLGTPFLPFPSAIMSLDWQAQPWEQTGVGEVFGAPRTFAGWERPNLPDNGHVCGDPADFTQGCLLDVVTPPVQYTAGGLPTCCGQGLGVQVGGDWSPVFGGGVVIGGDYFPSAGGVEIGGDWNITTGGVEIGGDWNTDLSPTPGTSCSDAPEIELDTDYNYTVSGVQWWWALDLPHGTYHVTVSWSLAVSNLAFAWRGTCPLGLTLMANEVIDGVASCFEFTFSIGLAPIWFVLNTPGSGTLSFRVSAGAC